MNIAAIDPGLSGGLAILHGGEVTAKPLPIAGKDLDLGTFSQWLKDSSPGLVVIEKVHSMPGQGVASMFKFGQGFGAILGIAAALTFGHGGLWSILNRLRGGCGLCFWVDGLTGFKGSNSGFFGFDFE